MSCELSHALSPARTHAVKKQDQEQKELVTTIPVSNKGNLDYSLSGAPPTSEQYPQEEISEKVDFSLPSPSVKVGSKEVLMSPWMPVRSSLGIQMELAW